jgi:hypothetical protein
MNDAPSSDDIPGLAASLAGAPILRLERLVGGRNSQVFRVETAAATYALKLYPAGAAHAHDRLGTETAVLRWMEAHNLPMTPLVVASDRSRGAALLTWAEGEIVGHGVGISDVAQACAFLRRLHDLRGTPALPPECLAAEACLSGAEIERQMRSRIAALRALRDPALTVFLDRHVEPALAARLHRARVAISAAGGAFTVDLPRSARSQVPGDFGFHNALRGSDGRLTFIDFEYFGWDDPAKLIADLLLHPGARLDDAARACLRSGAFAIYGSSSGFAARLDALLPLIGLRWALILLNEFHPDRWRHRVVAGATESWADAKQRQLEAAHAMLRAYRDG